MEIWQDRAYGIFYFWCVHSAYPFRIVLDYFLDWMVLWEEMQFRKKDIQNKHTNNGYFPQNPWDFIILLDFSVINRVQKLWYQQLFASSFNDHISGCFDLLYDIRVESFLWLDWVPKSSIRYWTLPGIFEEIFILYCLLSLWRIRCNFLMLI